MAAIHNFSDFIGSVTTKFHIESRDCWCCVHIEEAMGYAMPRVCEKCKWSGKGAPGPKFRGKWIEPVNDNFVARKDGRWDGTE